jgi:hypothetical protein
MLFGEAIGAHDDILPDMPPLVLLCKLARGISIFTLQHWSEQPCVRPVCAVLMTAGLNALRGSGPGQKHAFDDAVALVLS